MKMRILLLAALSISVFACAQRQNNNWYFGANAAITFSTGLPAVLTNSAMFMDEGTSSISDQNGNLLFYTNGINVFNKNHQQMPNGFGLAGNISSTQSALVIPKPGDCNLYYIFTVPAEDSILPMCYSVVDISLHGGLGDVISKNVPLHRPVNERLTATIDHEGTGYWVVAQEHPTNAIVSYHVTTSGVSPVPVITNIPILADTINSLHTNLGYMKISSNGAKLAYTYLYYNNTSVLLDFDNSTGAVSNPVVLYEPYGTYGVEFSLDNSKLYIESVNAPFMIWQFDVNAGSAAAIQSSRLVIDSIYLEGVNAQYGGALQLGPDGKIYAARLQRNYIGVINSPNLPGALCNYTDSAVYLGRTCYEGLPNLIKQYVAPPTPFITLGKDTVMCPEQTLLLSPGSHAHYLWQDNSTDSFFSVTEPGLYHVTVADTTGCTASDSITVSGFLSVEPALPEVDTLCTTVISFSAASGFATYLWNTGDTTASINVDGAGIYTVTVHDSYGCTGIDSTLVVRCDTNDCGNEIAIPNAFTPNGDGNNDIFSVFRKANSGSLNLFRMDIYNRWGELVFETSDENQGWDGRFKGKDQPSAVFVYTIGFECNGESILKRGSLILLR